MIHRDFLSWLWFWFEMHSGTLNEQGPYYGFFSGIGSDLGELALLTGIIGIYKHHKCATCFRIAHHDVAGTGLKTCHKHANPEDHARITKEHHKKYPGLKRLKKEK